jgi:beta-mannanase
LPRSVVIGTVAAKRRAAKVYQGARIEGNYYSANYGSTTTSDAPWAGNDTPPNAWTLYEAHQGKATTYVQYGLGTSWPPPTFLPLLETWARTHGSFTQFDWGTTIAGLGDILADNSTARTNMGTMFTAMKNSLKPILFRPLWEMNGNWGAGSVINNWQVTNYTAAQYVTIWRNLWKYAADVAGGFTVGSGSGTSTGNLSFFWCPNTWVSGGATDPTNYYPGDAYVDWLGFDGYAYTGTYVSPATTFDQTYNTLVALNATKPFAIGEFGVSATIGTPGKAAWFNDFFGTWLPAHSRVKAINYFNYTGTPSDTYIEQGTGSQTAWAAGLANSKFAANIVNSTTFPNGAKVPVP